MARRQSIMDTYKEILAAKKSYIKSEPIDPNKVLPSETVMDYTFRNGRKEGLLYNNRIFCGYINPSQLRKDEYEANRNWILKNFPKQN